MHLLLLLPACFLPPRTQAEETIRGCESRPHSRPYMAHLKFSDKDFQYICSGFLIQEDFVLTAAHCNEHSVTVILGCHNTSKYEKTQQIIPVSRAIPHPDYDSKSYANDIMLLKLLSLPSPSARVKLGQVCSVASWGRTSAYNWKNPDTLQEVDLTIQDDFECKSSFQDKYNKAIQLCSGAPGEDKNFFQRDSGGPLVCNSVAQGIVSYEDKCGAPPGVYTKVSSFLHWIKKAMQGGTGS